MRRANYRPFLSFARTARPLPVLLPGLANTDRDRLREPLPHPAGTWRYLVFQVIWDVGHHYSLFEQQSTLQKQRILVVQEVLPPLCRDKLGEHNSNHLSVRTALHAIYVVEKGTQQRAIWRSDHDQIHP